MRKKRPFWLSFIAAFYFYNSFIAFGFYLSPYEPGMDVNTLLFRYPVISLFLSLFGAFIGYGLINFKKWTYRLVILDFFFSVAYYIAEYEVFALKKFNLSDDGLLILVDLVIYFLIFQYIFRPEIKILFVEKGGVMMENIGTGNEKSD